MTSGITDCSSINYHLTMQADEPLGTFMDYCTYGHMIDNVVLLVTGTLHERDVTVSFFHTMLYQIWQVRAAQTLSTF